MANINRGKLFRKIALVVSLGLLLLWVVLGTGASLAWFTDTSTPVKNILNVANFDLEVSFRDEQGNWKTIEGRSDIFDDAALYEPGYVQVVYLRIENKGDIPFDCKTAVSVMGYTTATDYYGQEFVLQEYLKFGVAYADSEEAMDALVETRTQAKVIAKDDLSDYASNIGSLNAGEEKYMVIVVRMPEEVTNEANYRRDEIPMVELGIVVQAMQQGGS
ncbi:MAG: hypothetical protein J6L76_07130 [Clostridia bacterium]|nr:hypothetical protein [Clostridia bacterium]